MKVFIVFASIITISQAIGDSIIIRSTNKLLDAIGYTPEFGVEDLPANLDWRDKGVILPVMNQGQCGQSEVINAVDAISSFAVIQAKKALTKLSQQQIFDCSTNPHWCPCGASGNSSDFYKFLLLQQGIDTELSYPYTGKCGNSCRFTKSGIGAKLTAYAENNIISEALLQQLLQNGPVTAEVNANTESFQTYAGGIFLDRECTATEVNHSLLVVGYGSENGQDFWIARNSWGENWGEKGYIRIGRNEQNLCGIATKLALPWIVS